MNTVLHSLLLEIGLPSIAALLLLALLLQHRRHLRAGKRRSELEISRFNHLHLLASAFSGKNGPPQLANLILERTLQMMHLTAGYVRLRAPRAEEAGDIAASGLSAPALERLASAALRSWLQSGGDRWGSLMVFPDLGRSDLLLAWRRDPLFREFRKIMLAEGIRTLLMLDLSVRENSYGTLFVASRSLRAFDPNELRLMLAVGKQIGVGMENRSLRQDAERHTEELKILHEAAEELSATFDFGEQRKILRKKLAGLLGATHFYLAFQDSVDGPIEVVAAFGDGPAEHRDQADRLARYVLQSRSPLRIGRDSEEAAQQFGMSSESGIQSWAGVPIRFSDGSMGVLAVADFERSHAVDERQFELLRILADEAAAAIENARLFERERKRARHLARLNEVVRRVAGVLSPAKLLSDICLQIRGAFGYDLVRVMTMAPEPGELVVEAQEGYPAEIVGRRFKLGEGLTGIAAQRGEPILANRVDRDARYIPVYPGVRSCLSLPLMYRGVGLGVLCVESFRENRFLQCDVLTLRTLSDQLAIALHNARAYQLAREQAITDGLTGLKTHRYFMESLEAEWRRAARSGRPFSLIMLDLDRFKQVNDQYGHLEGDRVLTAVARVLETRSRQSNVAARLGGDEFAILMPEGAADQAEGVAERVCRGLASDIYLLGHSVTASFGVATFPDDGVSPEEILRVADSGVYLAKHENGNCVRRASRFVQMADVSWEQYLLEAYLGVAVKRMFPTGPEAFDRYLRRLRQVAQSSGESVSVFDVLTSLAYTLDAKDHYTRGHSQSVSRLAEQLALQVSLPKAEAEEVRLAGIVHDIGKIGIPESVLDKPARLTPDEFELMKTHAVLGDRILEPLKLTAIERIRRMVRHHHEWMDGQGYPDRLRGEQIPLGARILTIADAFDTMVADRSYKKGLTVEESAAELRQCAGSQFDGELVEAFLASLSTRGDPRRRPSLESVTT